MKEYIKRKEFFRDLLGLASPIMFVLVLARAAIEPYRPFMDRMMISGIFLLVLYLVLSYDGYSARIVPMAFFTSSFYQDLGFTVFVSIVVAGVLYSSYRINEKKRFFTGVGVGVVVTLIGLLMSTLIY
ncbi:MAG: hypothetical protein ACLFTR_00855 [Candidatus Woesearchaeota archaeon]